MGRIKQINLKVLNPLERFYIIQFREKAGVFLTDHDTVNNVERMKVPVLIQLHTALAIYGCVLGYDLISEEIKDTELKKLVWQIGPEEGMVVVMNPGILSAINTISENFIIFVTI